MAARDLSEKENKLKESKEKKKLMAKKIGQLQKLVKLQKQKMIKEGLIVEDEEKGEGLGAADKGEADEGGPKEAVSIKWKDGKKQKREAKRRRTDFIISGDACYAFDQSDSMWHEGVVQAVLGEGRSERKKKKKKTKCVRMSYFFHLSE